MTLQIPWARSSIVISPRDGKIIITIESHSHRHKTPEAKRGEEKKGQPQKTSHYPTFPASIATHKKLLWGASSSFSLSEFSIEKTANLWKQTTEWLWSICDKLRGSSIHSGHSDDGGDTSPNQKGLDKSVHYFTFCARFGCLVLFLHNSVRVVFAETCSRSLCASLFLDSGKAIFNISSTL